MRVKMNVAFLFNNHVPGIYIQLTYNPAALFHITGVPFWGAPPARVGRGNNPIEDGQSGQPACGYDYVAMIC